MVRCSSVGYSDHGSSFEDNAFEKNGLLLSCHRGNSWSGYPLYRQTNVVGSSDNVLDIP